MQLSELTFATGDAHGVVRIWEIAQPEIDGGGGGGIAEGDEDEDDVSAAGGEGGEGGGGVDADSDSDSDGGEGAAAQKDDRPPPLGKIKTVLKVTRAATTHRQIAQTLNGNKAIAE